ncbi:LuxR C-terminal-related transcriptional regulator [Enterobacter asburiae]|uniref:helix-turn-helix transcriptional regulator n=1 Tax=Enterobacter TaxID=547 RepID=UPI0004DB45B4|nr:MULTISPECIES: LuxR C-terminal-related transcriptional regulator [Enterobacter]KFA84186.1 hypothetical protein N037_22215 [Enterobacter sp. EGD-HP1]MEB8258282.1 LuxR C-terminal-related transcriptional regulator [Enterobacter asburiae]
MTASIPAVVIVGDNAPAAVGLLALLRDRYPELPARWLPDVRFARQWVSQTPGCRVIALLSLLPPSLPSQLHRLLWLWRRTRKENWLVLYEGGITPLPVRLLGMRMLPLNAPLVAIRQALERVTYSPLPARQWPLTYRQWDVLRLLARGHSPKEISCRLHISEKTVSAHRTGALASLGLSRHYEWLLFCALAALKP